MNLKTLIKNLEIRQGKIAVERNTLYDHITDAKVLLSSLDDAKAEMADALDHLQRAADHMSETQ